MTRRTVLRKIKGARPKDFVFEKSEVRATPTAKGNLKFNLDKDLYVCRKQVDPKKPAPCFQMEKGKWSRAGSMLGFKIYLGVSGLDILKFEELEREAGKGFLRAMAERRKAKRAVYLGVPKGYKPKRVKS